MASRRIGFPGNHQTTYGDWGKTVLASYPNNPRFAAGNNKTVYVYDGDDIVAEFDFSEGTGWVMVLDEPEPREDREIPQFMEYDVDTLLYP
jgi:hypothetical protein